MALGNDGPNAGLDHAVIHHLFQPVLQILVVQHAQIHIEAHRLRFAFFVTIDADLDLQFQIADKNMADGLRRTGDTRGFGFFHSMPCTSGVCQIRCWPPSTAIIWPVTDGAPSR